MLKHRKIKNTGILFELLVRTITSDTLKGKDSPAINILKNHFTKTELGKEYKLYETVIKSQKYEPFKAEMVLSSILELSKKLNQDKIKKGKYNLIKEVKKHYDLDEFFKTKLPNYKIYASLYTLMEILNSPELMNNNIDQIIDNKTVLLEYMSSTPKISDNNGDFLEEFKQYDRDIRILSYKILLEKFNTKYDVLDEEQKLFLKDFINLKDSAPALKELYNSKVKTLKQSIKEINKKTQDPATKIKVDGSLMVLNELKKEDKINLNLLTNLLQYYTLLNELKVSNK